MRRSPLSIRTSERFLKHYSRSLGLQILADGALHDFERRYRADPSGCVRNYGRVAGSRSLLEFDVSGGARMVAHWTPGVLTLLDVGDHEVVTRARRIDVDTALATASSAPKHFYLASCSLLLRLPAKGFQQYANELAPDWIYHLDAEQTAVRDDIYSSAVDVLLSDNVYALHLIVGGPGTGKTSILLHILKNLADEKAFSIQLNMSEDLRQHLRRCLPLDLESFTPVGGSVDVVLVDDPDSLSQVSSYAQRWAQGRARLLVVAFDPVQLHRSAPDKDFQALVARHKASVHELRTCYRQKRNVGLATKQVVDAIAESTPYLDKTKINAHRRAHARLTALSNELRFPNPLGYAEVHRSAGPAELERELRRVLSQPGGLWMHTVPLLIALIDEQLNEPPTWFKRTLGRFKMPNRIVRAHQLKAIKGLEFQHAFILASEQLLQELEEGFSGAGRRLYNARRLLRIPFSRAKDSIATFGIPDRAA